MDLQENDDYTEDSQTEDNYDIEIYSKRAIFWFTFFFSTIFGGIMLMFNLRSAGYKKEALNVMLFSIVYYFFENYAVSAISLPMTWLGLVSLAFNIPGALILSRYFFKQYFPEDDYYPKSIMNPLIISILLILFNVFIAVKYMPQLFNK